MNGKIVHINPNGLMKTSTSSQVIITRGNGATIYIGGQNSVDSEGAVIGKGNIHIQTTQTMYNVGVALSACGASFNHIVKLNVYTVEGHDASIAFAAALNVIDFAYPPTITALTVSGLRNPDYLIEIDAVVFLPE